MESYEHEKEETVKFSNESRNHIRTQKFPSEWKLYIEEMKFHQKLLDSTCVNLTGDLPVKSNNLSELQSLYLSSPYHNITTLMERMKYFRIPEIFNLYIGFPTKRYKVIKKFLNNCPSRVHELFFNGSQYNSFANYRSFAKCIAKCADKVRDNFTLFSLNMSNKDFMNFISAAKRTYRLELFECLLPSDEPLEYIINNYFKSLGFQGFTSKI